MEGPRDELARQIRRAIRIGLHKDSRWKNPETNHARLVTEGFLGQLMEAMTAGGANEKAARSGARYIAHQIALYADGVGTPDGNAATIRGDIQRLATALREVSAAFDAISGTAAEYRVRILSGFFYDLPSLREGELLRRLANGGDPVAALGAEYDALRTRLAEWTEYIEEFAALDVKTSARHLNAEALFIEAIETWNEMVCGPIPRVGGRNVLFDILDRSVVALVGGDDERAKHLTEGLFNRMLAARTHTDGGSST